MTAPLRLNIPIEPHGDPGGAEAVAPPQVFARSILAPAGAPWDQRRAADLDARLGAPRPVSELYYKLHRLDPWRPSQASRYLAVYIRRSEVLDRFVSETEVDGRIILTTFEAAGYQTERNQGVVLRSSLAVLAVSIVAAGIVGALDVRARRESALESLEQSAAVAARHAASLQSRKQVARVLDAASVRGRTIADYLADLAWASNAKAPGAHIQALYWERGLMAVETRGPKPPFAASDRAVHKADKVPGPGLTLWGVQPASNTSPSAAQ